MTGFSAFVLIKDRVRAEELSKSLIWLTIPMQQRSENKVIG